MNEKYIKHTVKNLIGFANDLAFIDATETEYAQAIETLKTAESMLDFYDNDLFELQEQIDDLKVKIGKIMLDEMINNCREKVLKLVGVVF